LRFRAGTAAGTLAGSLFLYGSIADATANDYMARNDPSNGQLAYRAQTTPLLDGNCPEFTHLVGALCVPNPSITTDQNGVIGVTPTPTANGAAPVTGPIAAGTPDGPGPSGPSGPSASP
jgi:hypothetical protein